MKDWKIFSSPSLVWAFGGGFFVIFALWLLWLLMPVSEDAQQATDAMLVTDTRYVLSADSTDILCFPAPQGDTLLTHVVSADAHNVYNSKGTAAAQWVRRWRLLPWSGARLAVESFDTARICSLSSDDVMALLRRQAAEINHALHVAREQRTDVDYYLSTHTVTDNGFDIVARYSQQLTQYDDSLKRVDSLVERALSTGRHLKIRLLRRYFMYTYRGRIEYVCQQSNDSITTLRPQPTSAQRDVSLEGGFSAIGSHARLTSSAALPRLVARRPQRRQGFRSHIDSIGTYTGERDSLSLPHGYGRLLTHEGQFYEGEWNHGQREGVGFSMTPGKRLRLGEWKEDRFLGERITYTPERIYGIDISRFQHEIGRKRYGIDWKKLRITSLGTLSKKTVQGSVDYPVSFVYIKATEGTTIKSRYFLPDYTAARKAGYRTGAYHFFSVTTPGKAQAEHFLKNSRYSSGDLPPVLDLEPSEAQIAKAGGIVRLFSNVRAWLSVVEQRRGVRPILYLSQNFVNRHLSEAPDIKKKYDVWIARYGEYKPDVNLVYWQLCPDGRVRGIQGPVDINVYNGFTMN